MKKLFFIALILFTSCSKDDDTNDTNVIDLSGQWEMISIEFDGNNTSGTGDNFFYGSTFNIESLSQTYFRGVGNYPNGSRGQIIFSLQDNEYYHIPIDDTGVIGSNSITTTYNQESRLIDQNGNDIFVDNRLTRCDLVLNNGLLIVNYSVDGYNITHTYSR